MFIKAMQYDTLCSAILYLHVLKQNGDNSNMSSSKNEKP